MIGDASLALSSWDGITFTALGGLELEVISKSMFIGWGPRWWVRSRLVEMDRVWREKECMSALPQD